MTPQPLVRLLAGQPRDGGVGGVETTSPRWWAAFGLFSFGNAALDLGLLAALGAAAAQAQTPFVAMAHDVLVQAALAARATVAEESETTPEQPAWTTLRRSEVAAWLGLMSSPLLLRLPYGRRQKPVQYLDFEAFAGVAGPAPLLWDSGAIAVATLLG